MTWICGVASVLPDEPNVSDVIVSPRSGKRKAPGQPAAVLGWAHDT